MTTEVYEERDALLHQAMVNALGSDATIEEVQAKVRIAHAIQESIHLSEDELARLITEADPADLAAIDKIFGHLVENKSLGASTREVGLEDIFTDGSEWIRPKMQYLNADLEPLSDDDEEEEACCRGEITTVKKDGVTESAWCKDCHMTVKPKKLRALQSADIDRKLVVLERAFEEQETEAIMAPRKGKSLEEILEGDAPSLEELIGEAI